MSTKKLCTFTRQFSTLQDAGLPVLRSLKILEKQMKPGVLKNALIDVVEDVESGSTLSEAMGKHPKCFDRLYVNMVKAGEAGGALEIILQRLADFKEKSQIAQAQDHRRDGLSGRRHHGGRRHLDVHHGRDHPEVQKDLRRIRHEAAADATQILIDTSMWFADYWWCCRCSRWASGS